MFPSMPSAGLFVKIQVTETMLGSNVSDVESISTICALSLSAVTADIELG